MDILKVKQIEEHTKEIMNILEIEETDSNKDTPHRLAKMWENEMFRNRNGKNLGELDAQMKMFDSVGSANGLIVTKVSFSSICEHHWLPFSGRVYLGYIPNEKLIGLSKIPRIIKYFTHQPQLQEKLCQDILSYFKETVQPCAVLVRIVAEHTCVACRGVEEECLTDVISDWFYSGSPEDCTLIYKDFIHRCGE